MNEEILAWKNLIIEAKEPYPDKVILTIVKYFQDAESELKKADKVLSSTNKETIELASENLRKISKKINLTDENIIKLSKLSLFYYDEEIRKEAQSGWLSKTISGGAAVIPVVGALFSTTFAIKNIAYGIYEFAELIKKTGKTDLEWFEAFNADLLENEINKNKESPKELLTLSEVNKIANMVWDEGISSISNTIDSIKDWFFLVLDFISFGTSVWLDFGISAALFASEIGAQSYIGQGYDDNIKLIINIAEEKINEIDPYGLENEDLNSWWGEL